MYLRLSGSLCSAEDFRKRRLKALCDGCYCSWIRGSSIAQESEVESWNREMRKCGALVVSQDFV